MVAYDETSSQNLQLFDIHLEFYQIHLFKIQGNEVDRRVHFRYLGVKVIRSWFIYSAEMVKSVY